MLLFLRPRSSSSSSVLPLRRRRNWCRLTLLGSAIRIRVEFDGRRDMEKVSVTLKESVEQVSSSPEGRYAAKDPRSASQKRPWRVAANPSRRDRFEDSSFPSTDNGITPTPFRGIILRVSSPAGVSCT